MSSLYDLVSQSQILEQKLIETGGELTPELDSMLEINKENLETKVDQYYFTIERLKNLSKEWDEKADKYRQIARGLSNLEDTIKIRLKDAMSVLGVTEICGKDIKYKLVKTNPILQIDEKELPEKFFETTVIKEPKKSEIKKLLTEGVKVAGAKLNQVFALRSFVNRGVK